jgi:mono/diheme cytochrome c family protein
MTVRHAIYLFVMLATALMLLAQQAQQAKPTIKREAAGHTSPSSGKEMFESYCAPCHGKDAKGDGPAAPALKQLPANLTQLAKLNGGKYPADKVTSVLRGQAQLMAHGDQEMPVWGPVFWKMSQGKEEIVQMRIANLNRYIESLQEK